MCSLAGDFGFDPLGLGEDPESLRWYVQAELVHARFAMAGVAGILFTDVSIPRTAFEENSGLPRERVRDREREKLREVVNLLPRTFRRGRIVLKVANNSRRTD